MKNRRDSFHTLCALALALMLGLGTPARAGGLFGWLTGEPKATEAPAMAEIPEAPPAVTLPPADLLFDAAPTEAAPEPTVTPAPIPDATIEDDGMLRVLLRSLDGPQQLHLTLSGVYAVESDPGFRFDRDARVTLSAVEGKVYLAVGGLTIDMGPTLTLTRHRAPEGEENGIRIEEAGEETLFNGDLILTAEGDMLQAVLVIQIEEYLYGVVGYEMSDSFPLEALKAQAVAARTYAMQRKWSAGGKPYDLVDTTADQVFKGYNGEYVNIIQAVDVTRGVVGLHDGSFAVCYFTASNGGQTALASQIWGNAGGDDYLAMQDDPYDLENPRSLQNELTITPECEGSEALKGMLEAELGRQLAAKGYGEGEWAFDSIAAIEPVEPRFEGSRMYDGLRFGLRARLLEPVATPTPTGTPEPSVAAEPSEAPASEEEAEAVPAVWMGGETPMPTQEPSPEPTEVPRVWVLSDEVYDVTLDVYDQVKDGLSLGLNSADYELISVETEVDFTGAPQSFKLVMRRFGHGVGMSQRGAQWMAGHYGMYWQDILAFYYPGLSLERMSWPETQLTDLAALPDSVGAARPVPTPTPTPKPLPELKAGEHYAVVTATMLNVRERPTTAARAIDQLPKGRKLIVSSEPDADGWVSIHTGEVEGFVKAEYLERF